MARFDVYRNAGAHAADTPYLLDVLSDLLRGLDTRVVIPLRRLKRFPAVRFPENFIPRSNWRAFNASWKSRNLQLSHANF